MQEKDSRGHFIKGSIPWNEGKGIKIKLKCLVCKKDFETISCRVEKGRKYCSRRCYLSRLKRIEKICPTCHKLFVSRPLANKIYCSEKCCSLSQRRRVKRICSICGSIFEVVLNQIKKGGGIYCSRKCHGLGHSKQMKGQNNPHWNNGSSFEPYTIEFNEELKELIRFQDGYKCQKCGCPEVENNQKLTVHHVDYDKKNCKPSNLISLCNRCNAEVNSNRLKWTKHFQRKIKKTMQSSIIQLNFRFKKQKNAAFI